MGLLVGQSAGWQIKTVTYWSVDRSLRLVGPVGNRHRAQHLGPHLGLLHSSGACPRWGTPRASLQPPGAPGGDITVKPEVFLTPPRPRATVYRIHQLRRAKPDASRSGLHLHTTTVQTHTNVKYHHHSCLRPSQGRASRPPSTDSAHRAWLSGPLALSSCGPANHLHL